MSTTYWIKSFFYLKFGFSASKYIEIQWSPKKSVTFFFVWLWNQTLGFIFWLIMGLCIRWFIVKFESWMLIERIYLNIFVLLKKGCKVGSGILFPHYFSSFRKSPSWGMSYVKYLNQIRLPKRGSIVLNRK